MVMSDGTGICYVATCSVVYVIRGVKRLLRDMGLSDFNLSDQ